MRNLLRRLLFRPPAPAPQIANQVFVAWEPVFYRLYERCRYNGIICRARVVEAIRTDNRANIWLLISSVGAGLAGAIKISTGINTDPAWEVASIISVILAIVALWKKAPEIKYTVFESIAVFDDLSDAVQRRTLGFRNSGTGAEIEQAYEDHLDRLSAELSKLGPDHLQYATVRQKRLDRELKRELRREGIARP